MKRDLKTNIDNKVKIRWRSVNFFDKRDFKNKEIAKS